METDLNEVSSPDARSLTCSYVPRRRRILPGDAFFDDGDRSVSVGPKQIPLNEDDDEEEHHTRYAQFKCHMIGCAETFTTIKSYEIHYNGAHRNICRHCRRSYPSNHLLEIHILESHDAFFAVMAQKQPMYQCLVESCVEKFSDSQTRKEHLIKYHQYPADFRFQRGISKPRPKEIPNSSEDAMDTGSPATSDAPCDTPPVAHGDTSQTTCSGQQHPTDQRKQRVPVNIMFGRGGTRTFQRGHQRKQHKQKQNKGQPAKQHDITTTEEPMEGMHDENAMNIDERTEQEVMSMSNENS